MGCFVVKLVLFSADGETMRPMDQFTVCMYGSSRSLGLAVELKIPASHPGLLCFALLRLHQNHQITRCSIIWSNQGCFGSMESFSCFIHSTTHHSHNLSHSVNQSIVSQSVSAVGWHVLTFSHLHSNLCPSRSIASKNQRLE
ncbi:hypothetical protein FVEG_15559 [Fusarium verticillioides 7600]|uniref:Uncharacterized protein n=1 Tax=Gibberella moniliformis (strain M3125 / FGSC 7600) TaxID=334819 RepID=W7LXL0_GIBM7|nr:hypothetical protein FVEG_15559 [Fusarium verticillioides 7600]EWG43331.1 hypothetical protein FVEG_15559 [Fusarium verticillioides 7600]